MFCQNCGNEMNDGASFCSNCGWKNSSTKGIASKLKDSINAFTKNLNPFINNVKHFISKIKAKFLELELKKRVILVAGIVIVISLFIIIKNNVFSRNDNLSNLSSFISKSKKTGWVEENGAKYFYDDSGNKVVSNWKNVGGSWYYFDIDGKCVINDWRKIDDAYYYFNEEGIMQKNKWIENKYYVNASGKMLVNALTPDGYYVNKDGEYVDKVCFTTRKLISIFNEYNSLQPDKLEDYIVNSLKVNSKWLLYSWYAKEKDAAFDDGGNLWLYGKSNWEYSDAGCSYALKIDKNMTQTLYCNEHGHFNGYEAGMMEFSYINGQEVNSYNPYYGDSYIAILLEDINLSNYENIVHYNGGFYINDVLITNNWVYYNSHNYYVNSAGGIETNKWIGDRYVGSDGAMQTGGKTPDGYYIGRDGYAVKDINKDLEDSKLLEEIKGEAWYKTKAGLWYYFEKDRKTLRKGWFNDYRDNQTYYLDKTTGIMAVGWTEIDGDMYYFNESHENEPNWYEVGDGIYESFGKKIKAYGSMFKNEITPDGSKVDENGKLIGKRVKTSQSETGNVLTFGNYMNTSDGNKNAIEWIVLDDDKANKKKLLISKYIIDCKCYNEIRDKVTWETCTLRKWLNNDFYNTAFNNDEKNKIVATTLNQMNNPNNDKSKGGNATNDKVFLLSIDEIRKYFNQQGLTPDNQKLAAVPTDYAKSKDNNGEKLWVNNDNTVWHNGYGYFWLRSPGAYQRDAAGVDSNGGLDIDGRYVDVKVIGVRPAIWVLSD